MTDKTQTTPVVIGDCTLYLWDCREILPTLGKVDAVVTDPPYGIGYDPKRHKKYNGKESNFSKIENDEKEMNLSFLFSLDCPKIIWGAENIYSQLPHRGRWACWYKRSFANKPNTMPSGDFELAWMDKTSGFYKFVHCIHGGVINADSVGVGNNDVRLHPTQKPIKVMQFCLDQLPDCETILDPFMGSASTGIACAKIKRKFIGIEIDEKHFETACKRIEQFYKQPDFFVAAPEKVKQGTML